MTPYFSIFLLFISMGQSAWAETAQEKALQLKTVLQTDSHRFPALSNAQAAFTRGDEAGARSILQRFLRGEHETLSRLFEAEKRTGGFWVRHELLEHMAETQPEILERHVRATTIRLRMLLSEVATAEKRNRTKSLLANRLSPLRNAALDRAVDRMDAALIDLSGSMRGARGDWLVAFFERKSVMLSQFTSFIEALLNRYSTVEARADAFQGSLSEFYASRRFGLDGARLAELIEAESSEEQLRIYVNRSTVSSLAFAGALVAEVATIPFSGGASATAMPATLAALRTGVSWAARGIFITVTAADLIERFDTSGVSALKQSETYMDVLMLFASLPAPARASLQAGSFYQRYLQVQRVGDYAFFGIRGTQRIWEAINADRLALERGVSAGEIRRQSVVAVAAYLFYGVKWTKYPYSGGGAGAGMSPSQLGGSSGL